MNTKTSIKNLKILLFIIIFICGIISIIKVTYADADFSYKVVKNEITGPITGNAYEYEICLDALMYHISANGYDKKIGDECEDNFSMVGVGTSTSLKSRGYGWYLYKLKALQGFMEYCHSQNPNVTEAKTNVTVGTEPYTIEYNYDILVNLSENSLSKTSKEVMKSFWEGMYNDIQNEFKEYQDSYFFRENTLKAIEKIKGTLNSEGLSASNLSERNLSRNRTGYHEQSSKEYLTLLTTYMYSINREEKLASVGKGDLVPFLYYAEHTGETDPYIIGKYAYIALAYEFLKLSGTNYWTAEFDRIYFSSTGFADSEIFEEYDIETLEEWYDETYEKYKNDRGVKQNPLIGSDIDTIISSSYTINYQVEATKEYVENIYAELGIDMTLEDFIAKNALMAEYMMESSKLDDTIKDYNVSIRFVVDNLQRGTFEEKNGRVAVLSDFQTIEFDNTIEKVANQDKDNDSLTNKAELGDTKWQDITGFVEKMYIFKYGTNMSLYELKVDEVVINNGGYTDFNGNFVYGHVKKEKDIFGNIKVYYKTYDYKSNPALKDTDFDGMDDNVDGRPKDNKFQGMAKIERDQNLNIDYHNDYRHFFIDNEKYNSELAEMSLMISNLTNDEDRKLHIYQGGIQVGMMNTGGVLIGNMNITEYLSKIGFIPLTTIPLSNGKAYLCYKIVNYYGKEKLIFGIFVGGFDDGESYIKFITDTKNMHQNYEMVVNSVINEINNLKNLDLIKQYLNGKNYCYFITGKGIGGAIAAEVATKLGDTHNIYCYTFGIPNVKGTSTHTYIKNIVNEDDLLTKIHSDIGQDGDVYNKSIYWDLIPEYRHYVESPNRYKGNYKKTNTIRDNLEDIKRSLGWSDETRNIYIRELSEYLYSQIGGRIVPLQNEIFHDSRDYSNANNEIEERLTEIEEFTDSLTTANSTKAYWCLVKVLDGYDSKYYYDGEKKAYTETMVSAFTTSEKNQENKNFNESLIKVIKSVAQFYINHIPTYGGLLKTHTKNSTTTLDENDLAFKHLNANMKEYNPGNPNDFLPISYSVDSTNTDENLYVVIETHAELSDDKKVKSVEVYKNIRNILTGENTIQKIKNIERQYKKMSSGENLPMYQNGNDITGLTQGYYKWKEYINKYPTKNDDGSINTDNDKSTNEKVNNNFNGRNARDDCSGLVMLVYDIVENKKVGNSDYYTRLLMEKDSDISKELFKQGYVMYKKETDGWKKYKNNGENLTETIENNVNLSILEPGDLLVCNSGNTGHAEFYVGKGYNVVFIEDDARTNIERKKSGISTITTPDKFSLPTSNDTKAEGTFSWGSVKDEFPVEAGGEHAIGDKLHYFTYNSNGYFQHCECGNNKPTDSHDNSCSMNPNNVNKDRKYTVIWRKK